MTVIEIEKGFSNIISAFCNLTGKRVLVCMRMRLSLFTLGRHTRCFKTNRMSFWEHLVIKFGVLGTGKRVCRGALEI